MEVKNLQSWEEFESAVNNLLQDQTALGPNILFRGQANANWHLETTLERFIGSKQELMTYYILIKQVKSRVETFTDRNWKIPRVRLLR